LLTEQHALRNLSRVHKTKRAALNIVVGWRDPQLTITGNNTMNPLPNAGACPAPSPSTDDSDGRLALARKRHQKKNVFRSRVLVFSLFALAQQFTAATAFADSPCPPVDRKPNGTDNCPPPPDPQPPSTQADLVPTISSVAFPVGKVIVSMSISNQGDAATGQTKARVQLFKQKDAGFETVAFNTQDVTVSAVNPSAAATLSAQTASVLGFGPKNYKVCVTADALQQAQEKNEGNNTVCQQFLIHPVAVANPATSPTTQP
jgi:CARDB